MAITIYDEPQLISPASNPLMFTFSSDQTAQENFSFIVEVYVNSSLHSTHQVFRQFNTLSRFDCSGILSSTLESPLIVDGTIETIYDSAINQYAIIVYEKYGATPIVQASATSTTLFAFNGALRHPDFINWDYTAYDPNLTQDCLFLTSFPRDQKSYCGIDESFFLGFLEATGSAPLTLFVELFDISGSSISSASVGLTSSQLKVLSVGPQEIINNTTITASDFDSCYRYYVYVDVAGISSSEVYYIYLDTDCKRYATNRLHWLNKFGVWDSFTFTLVSVTSSNIESSGYSREKGVWNNTSYTYPLYQGEKVTYSKRATDQLTLNSDWIKEDVQQWLVRGLLESPIVYLEQSNGFEPVNINTSTYQFKTRRRDGLIQEQITIDRTYSFTSQLN